MPLRLEDILLTTSSAANIPTKISIKTAIARRRPQKGFHPAALILGTRPRSSAAFPCCALIVKLLVQVAADVFLLPRDFLRSQSSAWCRRLQDISRLHR